MKDNGSAKRLFSFLFLVALWLLTAPEAFGQDSCPLSGTTNLNFDSVTLAQFQQTDATPYLAGFGITFTPITPGATAIIDADFGGATIPASFPNSFYGQPPVTNSPVSYTLSFCAPLSSFSFTRSTVISTSTFPQWRAQALDANGTVVDSFTEGGGFGTPAVRVTLQGAGITSVRVDSFQTRTTFNHPPFDDFTLVAEGCKANVTRVKMFTSHILEIDLSGDFGNDPASPKSLMATTSIGGIALSDTLQLVSGSTGTQSGSIFFDLSANNVPRFTDNSRFSVAAGMSEGVNTCTSKPKDAVILLPVIIVPGIGHLNGGDGTFLALEAALRNVLSGSPVLGQSFELQSDNGGYPTLLTLNYRTNAASFLEGATRLDQLVTDVRGLTYADKVNIITHSKGGLVAREYVSALIRSSSTVNHMIMAEPPNVGALRSAWGLIIAPNSFVNLRNLLPTWPWRQERPSQLFESRPPNIELDVLNGRPMPIGIQYTLLYIASSLTQWTRTGRRAPFSFQTVPGDGTVSTFSMFGLIQDPNDPGRPPVFIPAFRGITLNAVRIDGPHLDYLLLPEVMTKIGGLLTQ